MAAFFLCLMTVTTFAATSQEKINKERAEINELATKALKNLYDKVPSSERVIHNCYAYATLSNTGMKLGIFGDAHGRGLAVNNVTGEKVYIRMKEMGIGIGLGVKEYDLIFVIANEKAWNSFISGDIKLGGSAEAAASDGKTGESIEGASIAANGIWVYQMTKKGLALEASIKGTKIYADKKLNGRE
ncbi:MAG: lipid-binding SYLF domain-containing protein [Selenomonadaceae bacterium]|nr:lipid-binding SYLF domain-containing protein [Selenomonadaceae bacterium]MBQ7629241.1 lipid-binding SYLF domain-containing protein [Selenomonadaceae bacterium]